MLQSILEHGSDCQRLPILQALQAHLLEAQQHRFAPYVLEKALVFGGAESQRALADMLLLDEQRFADFASSQAGCRVAAVLLRLPQEGTATRARQLATTRASTLKTTKYGRRLLEELKRCDGLSL